MRSIAPRLTRLALLLIAAAFMAACQADDPVARGKAFFHSYDCAKCHVVNGSGGAFGPDLTFVGFRKSPEFLETWLKNPHAWKKDVSMPNFYFKDHVRKDIVAYLSSLKGEAYLAGERPWDAAGLKDEPAKRGATIYKKVGCVTCHGKEGAGGYPNNNVAGGLVPPIKNAAAGFSHEELVTKIQTGVRHPQKADAKGADPLLYMPTWGEKLNKDEIEALAAYLISLKPKDTEDAF